MCVCVCVCVCMDFVYGLVFSIWYGGLGECKELDSSNCGWYECDAYELASGRQVPCGFHCLT